MTQWLACEIADLKVTGSNPVSSLTFSFLLPFTWQRSLAIPLGIPLGGQILDRTFLYRSRLFGLASLGDQLFTAHLSHHSRRNFPNLHIFRRNS